VHLPKIKRFANFYVLTFMQDQKRAMDTIAEDVNLKTLEIVQSPLFDVEIRGVPALKFMGDIVWR
jgi:arsenite-transporting ATPase